MDLEKTLNDINNWSPVEISRMYNALQERVNKKDFFEEHHKQIKTRTVLVKMHTKEVDDFCKFVKEKGGQILQKGVTNQKGDEYSTCLRFKIPKGVEFISTTVSLS